MKLEGLDCSKNELTKINLTGCTTLSRIGCNNNQLQLSDLFEIQSIKNFSYLVLGEQHLLPQTAIMGAELFSEQSIFDGIYTNYSITKDSIPASESDYTVEDGKLTFNAPGKYVVTMTNEAIGYGAKVIVPIEVQPVNIKKYAGTNIKVFPNPTNGQLTMDNRQWTMDNGELRINNVEIFDVYGRKVLEPPLTVLQSYDLTVLQPGIYFVKIETEAGIITKKIIKN